MKIIFFGLGSVASVMAQCLFELFSAANIKIEFTFIVRNQKKAKEQLRHMSALKVHSTILEIPDFQEIFKNTKKYSAHFSGAIACINTALPDLNQDILKFALKLGIHYCDLASDMYNRQTLTTMRFLQEELHSQFKRKIFLDS